MRSLRSGTGARTGAAVGGSRTGPFWRHAIVLVAAEGASHSVRDAMLERCPAAGALVWSGCAAAGRGSGRTRKRPRPLPCAAPDPGARFDEAVCEVLAQGFSAATAACTHARAAAADLAAATGSAARATDEPALLRSCDIAAEEGFCAWVERGRGEGERAVAVLLAERIAWSRAPVAVLDDSGSSSWFNALRDAWTAGAPAGACEVVSVNRASGAADVVAACRGRHAVWAMELDELGGSLVRALGGEHADEAKVALARAVDAAARSVRHGFGCCAPYDDKCAYLAMLRGHGVPVGDFVVVDARRGRAAFLRACAPLAARAAAAGRALFVKAPFTAGGNGVRRVDPPAGRAAAATAADDDGGVRAMAERAWERLLSLGTARAVVMRGHYCGSEIDVYLEVPPSEGGGGATALLTYWRKGASDKLLRVLTREEAARRAREFAVARVAPVARREVLDALVGRAQATLLRVDCMFEADGSCVLLEMTTNPELKRGVDRQLARSRLAARLAQDYWARVRHSLAPVGR